MVQFDNLQVAIEYSKTYGVPFQAVQTKGEVRFTRGRYDTKGNMEEDSDLFVDDIDWSSEPSGAFYAKVADGYKVKLVVETDNHKYFQDNVKDSTPSKNDVEIRTSNLFDSEMTVILYGGDYISIDIDEEHSGIYRFRLHLNGQNYNVNNPDKIDDETWVRLVYARLENGTEDEIKITAKDFDDTELAEIDFDTTNPPPPPPPPPPPSKPFEVHTMYDCATGDEYTANTQEEHDAYAELGYVHSMDECPIPSNGMSWKGVLIIGAVVVGIVLLLRFARNSRASDSSNSTKSPSDGGSSVE
tara:strand:- start:966 stop:1865 length:900 start_codon:yes stop_codon:yes gene_type:complete